MPHVTWDAQKGRAIYQRRFPVEVQGITGKWFRYRYDKSYTRQDADACSDLQTKAFIAQVDAALARLYTAEGDISILRASRERLALIRAKLGAANEVLEGIGQGIDRVNQTTRFYRMARELGAHIEDAPIKLIAPETVIETWIADRGAGNPPAPQARTAMRSALAALLTHTGKNFGLIDEADLLAYRLHLIKSGISRNMPSLANDHISSLKRLYGALKNNGIITTNPARDVKSPGKPQNKRPALTDQEARQILIAARDADPAIRWSNWLAAFSTMMNSEILAANASEFYEIDGQWVFDTRGRKGKTEFRPRVIPLHPALIREGFLDYLATRTNKPLFEGSPKGNSNKLNPFIHSLGIEKTFYSWRHRCIHQLDHKVRVNGEKIPPSLSRFVAGHTAKDIHERNYNHHEMPEEFSTIIAAIQALPDISM